MKNQMSKILIITTIICTIKAGINKCEHKLLEECICGLQFINSGTKFVVNCTNTGFNNTDMLRVLPEQTNHLIFTGNHLNILPVNIFGEEAKLPDLEVIDMTNNGIRDIKGKTFHHVTNVERLILNHNNISIAEEYDKNYHHPRVFSNFVNLGELHLTNAFADNTDAKLAKNLHDIFVNSGLTKLSKLHLEQNEIKSWQDDRIFCDLPDLQHLYLGDNKIPSLNFNISCLKNLTYLDLEYNNITRFSQKDLDTFDRLVSDPSRGKINLTLEIGHNPLKCDSSSKNLYSWSQSTSVIIRDKDLECINSKYGKRYLVNLKSLVESKHAKISKVLTVLLVVLLCISLTLLSAYIYLKKDSVRTRLSPVFEVITRKVQYTTIESQVDV